MTDKSIESFVRKLCRFQYEEVDDKTRQLVLDEIEQKGLTPWHSGSSLHAWDSCYEVLDEHYRLIGAYGHGFTVERIIDMYPEDGPIKETYK